MDQDHLRAKSHNVGKENTGHFRHSCHQANNHRPAGEKAGVPGTEAPTPLEAQAPTSDWTLPSLFLDTDTE